MDSNLKKICTCLLLLYSCLHSVHSQETVREEFSFTGEISGNRLLMPDSTLVTFRGRPVFSFDMGNRNFKVSSAGRSGETFPQLFGNTLRINGVIVPGNNSGLRMEVVFENTGTDTLIISNVVPFGFDSTSVHITGKGPDDLARAWLFRPGYRPVRVILPDNAWELGYTSFPANDGNSVCAISRRTGMKNAVKRRYQTLIAPGGELTYTFYSEIFRGEWQNGLKLMFRDRYLHDLEYFDNSLYQRQDLAWIRECFIIVLKMAWDREFFDRFSGKYTYGPFLKEELGEFGGIDVFGIWPTWPRLGLDQRNQWDLYRDIPGGTAQLRNFARISRLAGTRFFISYNPWDESTRKEDHLKGMAEIIAETEADGVVLDTRGNSSYELQAAADSVRKGVVMYSEGMAVAGDMPGIISGRVHNAIFLSPELNLNKLIKSDFSIFRVCDTGEDRLHREIAIAFFNGYGTELNMFRPGLRDDDFREDMNYLAKTTFILRQNSDVFIDDNWTPLISTTLDNVYVNKWVSGQKNIYTVLNMGHDGVNGNLFEGRLVGGRHWVSLWHHENLEPVIVNGKSYIPARTDSWHRSISGTRKEGSLDCIAEFPLLIKPVLRGDSLELQSTGNDSLLIWKGNPSYKTDAKRYILKNDTVLNVKDLFGYYSGKLVLQLTENGKLKDEHVIEARPARPWLVSSIRTTVGATRVPSDMVLVPGTEFSFDVSTGENFIPYPDVSGKPTILDSFLIDRYPVTNEQYHEFLMSSGYRPADTTRFLRHWVNGIYKPGQEKYPVVNVGYEDMLAYASWAGKRLPTEAEWQLAAQGTDKRKWPWGNEFHGALCNNSFSRPTPVDAFPRGASPFGAIDMVGNIWQMTADIYFNGSNYMAVIRGGSYYKPESNWWYLQGGPQPLNMTQILLLVSPGFDRSPTVGFRCVKDIDHNNFTISE